MFNFTENNLEKIIAFILRLNCILVATDDPATGQN